MDKTFESNSDFHVKQGTNPVDTGRKLNVHKTFNLRPVSTGKGIVQFLFFMSFFLVLKKRRRLGRRLNTRL